MGLRKACNQYRPYSNCITLRGQLSNWTSEDIVDVAKKNIEAIIEPIRGEMAEQTIWDEIGKTNGDDVQLSDGVTEFGDIGDSLKDEEEYNHEQLKEELKEPEEELKEEENYEWYKL